MKIVEKLFSSARLDIHSIGLSFDSERKLFSIIRAALFSTICGILLYQYMWWFFLSSLYEPRHPSETPFPWILLGLELLGFLSADIAVGLLSGRIARDRQASRLLDASACDDVDATDCLKLPDDVFHALDKYHRERSVLPAGE